MWLASLKQRGYQRIVCVTRYSSRRRALSKTNSLQVRHPCHDPSLGLDRRGHRRRSQGIHYDYLARQLVEDGHYLRPKDYSHGQQLEEIERSGQSTAFAAWKCKGQLKLSLRRVLTRLERPRHETRARGSASTGWARHVSSEAGGHYESLCTSAGRSMRSRQ